jgi:hypothetical protein
VYELVHASADRPARRRFFGFVIVMHRAEKAEKFVRPSRKPSVPCGRQSCLQAAFQAAVETEQTTQAVGTYFLRFHVSQASCGEAREIRRVSETAA